MKYMILLYGNDRAWKEMAEWTPEEIQGMVAHMDKINNELTANGEFVEANGLIGPAFYKVVRAGSDGSPDVTDGPFSESKEVLAGYWIVDVDNPARAYEIAAHASAAPGPGGKPLNMDIEVREVMGILLRDVP